MTKKELIKELELLADSCDSNYALEMNGYNRGVLDALDVVNKYFVLAPVSGSWVYVNEETPPNDIELLAKAPDGTIHLTSWRYAYDIFCCQCKSESAFDWQWKLV